MIRFFAGHQTAANLLMLMFLVIGVFALPGMRRETFPDYSSAEVSVTAIYPGASAEDVEKGVCALIEDSIDSITFVDEVRSEAREGLATVVVKMAEGGDFDKFLDDVRTEVQAITDFPELVEKPIIQPLGRTDLVVAIAVTGPMPETDLKNYCEAMKDRMRYDGFKGQVEVLGFSQRQFLIEVSETSLANLGLTHAGIAAKISSQSLDLPLGLARTGERDILIRFSDERRTVREMEELVIASSPSGAEVKLGSIAKITESFKDAEQRVVFNGGRAGLLRIVKNKAQDTLDIRDEVTAFLEKERATAPPGMAFHITQDTSTIVRDRLELLIVNGIQGLLLVFAVMWLFFSFKMSFWVVMGLPVSFLGGLFIMSVTGLTINMMTMVALLIAIGLLMDDAIVIAENIATNIQKGLKPLKAAIVGVSEVGGGVLSSFITTAAIFVPLSFIQGNLGKVLKVIPLVLLMVLTISIVEAFMILPNHLSHSMKAVDAGSRGWFRSRFDRGYNWFRDSVVGSAVDFTIRWRYLSAGVVLLVFALTIALLPSGKLKFVAFPDIDGDVMECRILLPQGTPLAMTEDVVTELKAALMRVNDKFKPMQPGELDLVENVSVQYNTNATAKEAGPHVATIYVDLLPAEEREALMDDVIRAWRAETPKMPDVISLQYREMGIGPAGLAIDIKFEGNDLEQLKAAAGEAMQWLAQYKGVVDLTDDLRPGKPEISLTLKQGATPLGLTARDIASQLRGSFYGASVREIQMGKESVEVNVRLADDDRDSIADLEYAYIRAANGARVPLREIVNIEYTRGYARIARLDGLRTVNLTGDVDPAVINTSELISTFAKQKMPEMVEKYPNIKIELGGQREESAKTGKSILRGFIIGLIAIFILLSFQFRNYIEPLTVMTAIPLAFIGVILGHKLLGLDLSMPSVIGAVSLAGVVVNNSILLMTFVRLRRSQGVDAVTAVGQASRDRLRAMLVTSLTTIAGLTPLLFETSLQAQVLIPLAVSIVFGLLATLVLVLFVVPTLYSILHDMRLTAHVALAEESDESDGRSVE